MPPELVRAARRPDQWPAPNSVVMFRTARRTIVWFGPLSGLALGVGIWFAIAFMRLLSLEADRIAAPLALSMALGVMVGSRAFSILLDFDTLRSAPSIAFRKRGLAFQGGLVGAVAAIFVVAHLARAPVLLLCDAIALALPLGHAIGRLACLSYGCCYGRPTRVPWAIVVQNPESKVVREWGTRGVAIHPTQLYQSFGCLAHAWVLWELASHGYLKTGQVTFTYLVLGALGRFALERYRGGRERRRMGLTPFQCFALVQLCVGLVLFATVSGAALPLPSSASVPQALVAAFTHSWPWIVSPALLVGVHFGVHGKQVGTL